nr:hypothetical protein [Tanacetum cinerariifolium]
RNHRIHLLWLQSPRKGSLMTSTLPKSQSPEALGALSKKCKRPKSKKSPTKTMVTLRKPTEGSEQSHSDEALKSEEDILGAGEEMDDNPQSAETQHRSYPPYKDKPTSSTAPHTEASDPDSSSDKILKKYDDTLPLTKRQLVKYLRKVSRVLFERIHCSINDLYMSSLKKSRTTINDLYKGLEVITQLLKDITNFVKDDPATNKKIEEAFKTLANISTQTIEILSLVRSFDFSTLQSTVKNIQDYAFKQEEASAAWMKSFTNMAWNLGSIISGLERAQTHIKSSMSSLQEDTSSIKSIMTEMYNALRGQSSSAPSSSVTPTFALTDIPANVKPEEPKQSTDANIEFIGSSTHPPSITQAQPITIIHHEPSIPQREGKGIATDDQAEDQRKMVKALSVVRPNPDEPEEIKKAEEEARLNAISKNEVIKVVREEAKKLGIHPKEAITTKAGELFKKAQDAEHDVLKRQHTKKLRKSLELRKHKEIISKKKNEVVKDLMNSLSQRYERLRQIPEELGIQSALPAPEQAPSQTLGRKQKHMKLEPETRIHGLECN